jgi:hypothetical protein
VNPLAIYDAPPKSRFELRHTSGVPVASEDLLADLKQVAIETGRSTVTYREYERHGRYSAGTVRARFGSWNKALTEAGFDISNEMTIDETRLFENIERLWIALGRQPTKRNLGTERSEFSERPYIRAFGSWRKALQAFVDWANTGDSSSEQADMADVFEQTDGSLRATPRNPNLRTRFLVMRRDGFRCRYCGKSPATHAGVELVLDHVQPWSRGGETNLDNLKTSCVKCNAGKSNLDVHG